MPYEASRDEDGNFSISNVPVFAEVAKGIKGAPFNIGEEWMRDAVKNAKMRAREGYLPPLHFEHHGGNDSSFKAGHYKLTRVGRVRIGGSSKFAIFADFVKVPEHVFRAIMANDWPYRSVEIASYQEREIESIALLDDDTPFHKFELLNADTINVADAEMIERDPYGPVGAIAFAKTDRKTVAALFHFGGENQMKVKLTLDDAGVLIALGEDGQPFTGDVAAATFELAPDALASFAKHGDSDEDDDSDNLPKTVAELKKLGAAVAARLAKFEDDEDDEEEEEDDGKDGKPVEISDKGLKASMADVAMLARLDAKDAEITRLKAGNAKRDAKKEEELEEASHFAKVEDAVAGKLKGYHVSKETKIAFAGYSKAGPKVLATAVAEYARLSKRDGPDSLDDSGTVDDVFDENVSKFAKQGEEAARAATSVVAMFEKMKLAGMKSENERAGFIGREMNHRGFAAAS